MSGTPRISFFGLGWQYYIAGRYSVFAGLIPVAGNILHHAVEMFLKGGLATKGDVMPAQAAADLKDAKDRGHRLDAIWQEFKAAAGDPALSRFDTVISELDRFESLRYPDNVLKNGMMAGIGRGGKSGTGRSSWNRREPFYEVYLNEIDDLVFAIHSAASVNPDFYASGFPKPARQFLYEENFALQPAS